MKKTLTTLAAALTIISASAVNNPENILPLPQSIRQTEGTLAFSACKAIYYGVDGYTVAAVREFTEQLSAISGIKAGSGSSRLSVIQDRTLPAEGYKLCITKSEVKLSAGDYNGFIYGLQTLRQLLPEEIYGRTPAAGADWTIKCCEIEDAPYFGYRGAQLDVVRHFFSVSEVKKYLDAMYMCKMNRFHWHLTDDQGWRVPIDSYPRLATVSAWRKGTQIGMDRSTCDGVKYGGCYTKDEIREVVAYAQKLGIEVIPEIDLPGHMVAAIAAYPELACTDGPFEVRTCWGISKEVLCPAKEKTFKFLEAVIDEVAELFPCEYFHIGGDECPKTAWKACPACQAKIKELGFIDDERGSKEDYLQSYVMSRIQKYLAIKGKKVIGWDEILKGDPAPGTTIMHWRGGKDCTEASRRGFDTILVPSNVLYYDYSQLADHNACPPSITRGRDERVVTFSKSYAFQPFAGLSKADFKHVIGVQCNLWTEYIPTTEHLEYMAMPRMFAASELQWQDPLGKKDLDRVKKSVEIHGFKMLDASGFIYCTKME